MRVTFEPTSQTNRNVHVHGIGLCVRVCVWFVIVTAMLPSPRIIVYFFERVIILCEMRTFIFASVYEIFDKSSVWVRIWLLDGFFLLFLWVSDWKERNGEREIERVCGWHAVSARGAAHSRPRQLEREGGNVCVVWLSSWSLCKLYPGWWPRSMAYSEQVDRRTDDSSLVRVFPESKQLSTLRKNQLYIPY